MEQLIGELSDDDPISRMDAINQLAKMGPRARGAVPALRLVLKQGDRKLRAAAARALDLILERPDRVAPLLVDLLADGDRDLRAWAVGALQTRGEGAAAVPFLADQLRSEDRGERMRAVWHLRILGSAASAAVPALVEAADSDGQSCYMYATTLIVIDKRYDLAAPVFLKAMERMSDVADSAAHDLGRLDEDGLPILETVLRDGSVDARLLAVRTLAHMDVEVAQAVPLLERAMRDEDHLVRKAAEDALNRVRARGDGGARQVPSPTF